LSGAILAIGAVALTACAPSRPSPPTRSPAASPGAQASTSSERSRVTEASPALDRTFWPTDVDGLEVMTVSQLLAARDSGALSNGRGVLRGWWSWLVEPFSCMPPEGGYPSDLEFYCTEGMFGIAEEKEKIGSNVPPPDGPWLQPTIYPHHGPSLVPPLHLQWPQQTPVEIVATGHFDDLRALDCRPESVEDCRKVFVLDRVAHLEPWEPVPPPSTPLPWPTLPPGYFDLEACSIGTDVYGPFEVSSEQMEAPLPFEGPAWGYRTTQPVAVGDGRWRLGPEGQSYQPWAVVMCYAPAAGDRSSPRLMPMPGTEYLLWNDGIVSPGSNPVRPPGFP
jgi:hypothetical protein